MPSNRATMRGATIKARLRKAWRDAWWGGQDCDRCPSRTQNHPCDHCPRWDHIIKDYRAGRLTKEVPFK